MSDELLIDQLLAERGQPDLCDLAGRRVVIYGAGGKARSLAWRLRGCSRVVAFIDQNAAALPEADYDAPIMTPRQWDERALPHDTLAIGVHNPADDLAPILQWAQPRFSSILSLPDLMDILPGWEGTHYWAAPRAFFQRHRDSLARALSRFEEHQSKAVFLDALATRLLGARHRPSPPSLSDLYAPLSLPGIGAPLRLIDCGAARGEGLRAISARESIEAIAALEPDPAAQEPLRRVCESLAPNPTLLQAGVWSSNGSLRLDPAGSGGSFIEFSSPSEQTVAAFSIDSLLERQAIPFAPNFIKMDIEGAEAKALQGAHSALARHRPALAVSAYHRPSDLWALADAIANLELGYRFYLRSHGHNGFDLVLYARCD